MSTYEVRSISISIERDWREAYAFACVPENFPRWASGLASGLERAGEEWIGRSPEGQTRIRFSPPNDFGVLDHTVVIPSGAEVSMPVRIVANGTGCEVTFTLFRQPGMSAEQFAADAEWVQRDLAALKALLEA
jgi:hypothetical protein